MGDRGREQEMEEIRKVLRVDPELHFPNDVFRRDDGAVEIVLRDRSHKETGRCVIDAEDLDAVKEFRWGLETPHRISYCRSHQVGYLHVLLMRPPDGMVVDHINGDGLDCRRENMRVVTPKENANNRHDQRTRRKVAAGRRPVVPLPLSARVQQAGRP